MFFFLSVSPYVRESRHQSALPLYSRYFGGAGIKGSQYKIFASDDKSDTRIHLVEFSRHK